MAHTACLDIFSFNLCGDIDENPENGYLSYH